MSAILPAAAGLTQDELEHWLAARLGISPDATPEEVAAAHETVAAYLAQAPRELRGWAAARAAEADEAFALLSDPAALAGAVALVGTAAEPALEPGGSATPPTRRAAASEAIADDEFESVLDEVEPGMHRDVARVAPATRPTRKAAARGPAKAPLARPSRRRWLRPAMVAGALVAAVVVIVGVYEMGAPTATASNGGSQQPAASASPALDQAKVSQLMTAYQANPNDTSTLMSLANEFFNAGDYQSAATWLQKLLAIDPENVDGLLAAGASAFNLGDVTTAEADWKQVVSIDPNNVEAHYDLGFLYLNQAPPDLTAVQREWTLVVQLDPGSDVAKTVQAHLDALASMSPSPSPTPSASAPASTAPSASPIPNGSAQP